MRMNTIKIIIILDVTYLKINKRVIVGTVQSLRVLPNNSAPLNEINHLIGVLETITNNYPSDREKPSHSASKSTDILSSLSINSQKCIDQFTSNSSIGKKVDNKKSSIETASVAIHISISEIHRHLHTNHVGNILKSKAESIQLVEPK